MQQDADNRQSPSHHGSNAQTDQRSNKIENLFPKEIIIAVMLIRAKELELLMWARIWTNTYSFSRKGWTPKAQQDIPETICWLVGWRSTGSHQPGIDEDAHAMRAGVACSHASSIPWDERRRRMHIHKVAVAWIKEETIHKRQRFWNLIPQASQSKSLSVQS